jgi:transcription initiation factor TFIID subunit TAF12
VCSNAGNPSWLENAEIREGTLFRRLVGQTQIGGALNPGSIAPIFKRVAQWIGMPARFVDQVSGHSTRVGATQDLAELDIDLAAITPGRRMEVTSDAAAI